jgi:hypothetical protein
MKHTKLFHPEALQNTPKLAFLVWKCTIWQPCLNAFLAGKNGAETRTSLGCTWQLNSESKSCISRKQAARTQIRVARWFVFKPKIPIWVNFGGPCNWRCCYILGTLGLIYGQLVYFKVIWYILRSFDIFCGNLVHFPPFWYGVPRKIWQPWLRFVVVKQGDKIGRFCAYWAIVYFGQFKKLRKRYKFFGPFFLTVQKGMVLIWSKNGLGNILADFFTN